MTPVDFAGGLEAFPVQFSYRQILEADAHPGAGAVDLSLLKDRIVIVGVTFAGNADLQPTPFSTTYPMFLIQATMIDNILRGEFPRRPPAWVALVVCLLLGAALGALTFSFRPVASLALTALAGGGYAACAAVAFTRGGWLVPLVAPLTAILAAYVLVTTAQYVEVRAEKIRVFERLKYLGHLVESAAEAIFSFDPAGTHRQLERRRHASLRLDQAGGARSAAGASCSPTGPADPSRRRSRCCRPAGSRRASRSPSSPRTAARYPWRSPSP